MTQGGGGFTSGEDFIAARVSIDVPTEGIQTLKEMSTVINNFRASVETSARSSESFVGYLQQMTQAANMATQAHQQLAAQLQTSSDLQQRFMGGGGMSAAQALPLSRSAPQGYVDNFAGMGAGMGGTRQVAPGDVPNQIQQQYQSSAQSALTQNPRQFINAGTGVRGRVQPGDFAGSTGSPSDLSDVAQRIDRRDREQHGQARTSAESGMSQFKRFQEGAHGLAGNLINEMGVGGGGTVSALSGIAQGVGGMSKWLKGRADAAPGGSGPQVGEDAQKMGAANAMGKASGVLGGVGAGLGAAAAGLGTFEKAGAMYQGYKNMGLLRGGGAAEGLSSEIGIRSMALNPFLTTEQSRQIVMAGLTEGYSGKNFDSVTQFMASNLKDMNLAQPISSFVLTPSGWAKMGELAVGDEVFAWDGSITTVTKVHERPVNAVYEVKFTDGTSARCTMDHLWAVYQTNEKQLRVMFLKDMVVNRRTNSGGLLRGNGLPRFRVPLTAPVAFPEKDLPLDPYLLGLLLGDGSFGYTSASITCFEEEFYSVTLPEGVTAVKEGKGCYRLTGNWNRWNPNPIMVALRELGLGGVTCAGKFIPEAYLMGSVQQRMALLQGLIDTDGCVDTNGIVFFTNTSRQLIDDVRSLVLSLGGEVTIGEVAPKKSVMKTGQIINSGLCFRMQIRLPGSLGPPCRLKRKADRWVPRMLTERKRSKGIVSVTQVDAEKCRCITIAHPDQLYITDDYTVTHNSVSDSVQMLRKNVAEGGQSITGLGVQLATLKEVSKNGITSLPDLAKAFQQTTASAVSLGIPGDVAGAWPSQTSTPSTTRAPGD